MNTLLLLLCCFVLTVAVEWGIMLCLFRSTRFCYYTFLGNLLTNPALNILLALWLSLVGGRGYFAVLALLELFALLAEALVLRALCGFTFTRACAVSLLLNASSFCAGLVLNALI